MKVESKTRDYQKGGGIMTQQQRREFVNKITNWIVFAFSMGAFIGYWVGKLL